MLKTSKVVLVFKSHSLVNQELECYFLLVSLHNLDVAYVSTMT